MERSSQLFAAWTASALALETAAPLRPRVRPRRERWPENVAIGLTASLVHGLVLKPAMKLTARAGRRRVPRWLGFVLLDGAAYLWHRMSHVVPFLWRFHSRHHDDSELDMSTAIRLHAGEMLAGVPIRCAQVALLGVEPAVVSAYELALQSAALFHHANLRMPLALERVLSWVIVTPRMHGAHHTIEAGGSRTNCGVVFAVWDLLLGTHRFDPADDDLAMGVPRR